MSVALLFLILALICFVAAAAGVSSRVNLEPLGLAFATAAVLAQNFG